MNAEREGMGSMHWNEIPGRLMGSIVCVLQGPLMWY